MRTKRTLTIVLFLGFCVLIFHSLYGRFTIASLTFGAQRVESQNGVRRQQRAEEQPRTPKRVDLGKGIEITEYSESEKGEVVSRFVKITRKGETLVTCGSVEQLGKRVRTYYHNGKEILAEVFDKDGFIEMLILVGADRVPIEVFERKKDGTTLPVSGEQLEEMRTGAKLIFKTFQPIAEAARKGTDEQQMRSLVEDAVRKVEAERRRRESGKNKGGREGTDKGVGSL